MNTVVINAPENSILKWWQRLEPIPGGARLFSMLLGWMVPYSGSIDPLVEGLGPGRARVSIRDRRKVRNHLKSIHAIALINLGEIATGLAVISSLPDNMRGIVLSLQIEYIKKARGKLSASASLDLPEGIEDNTAFEIRTEIIDESGDVVAIVRANWLLGYKKQV
jgi:acyl-coenzyme A thioesterase PaaI-like protein